MSCSGVKQFCHKWLLLNDLYAEGLHMRTAVEDIHDCHQSVRQLYGAASGMRERNGRYTPCVRSTFPGLMLIEEELPGCNSIPRMS